MKDLPTIHLCFQLSKSIIFSVDYYRCGNNTNKYFSTSAAKFNQPKTDFNQCGQAQKDLLKGFTAAMAFYKKWDIHHTEDLTAAQHAEMLADIEVLKDKYNFIESDREIPFSSEKELSKQLPKRFAR